MGLTDRRQFALIEREPAPAWIPVAAFGVVALIVGVTLIWALRVRGRRAAFDRAQQGAKGVESVRRGSQTEIVDGAAYSVDALLRSMSSRAADYGPAHGEPHNEGAEGEALGLTAKISYSTYVSEPHLYWGRRHRGQVFVRLGADEAVAGGHAETGRHLRCFVVLRVATPPIDIDVIGGRPECVRGSTPAIDRTLGRLAPSPGIWGDLCAYGGPEGLVLVRRDTITGASCWPYDLWLAERLAADCGWAPLADARIGPAWTIPYGLGRSFEPRDRA